MTDATALPPSLLQRVLDRLRPYRRALAPLSFIAGLASFLLIQRSEQVAQGIAVAVLLSWLAILFEAPLTRGRLPRGLLRYLVQSAHQEIFFFALPFFFATTSWHTPQVFFTGALVLAGLATIIDPVYFDLISARRPLLLIFHALSVFVAMLVLLPILLHLTTGQSLALASIAIAVLTVPGLTLSQTEPKRATTLLMLLAAISLGALAWTARPWVPPATLWVRDAVITSAVDTKTRSPAAAVTALTPAQVHQQGVYAWTAIHAPRGLHERVYHRWRQNGTEVDRIALELVGGREAGYRAWSFKQGFPADPRGDWAVDVVTEGGQLIGQLNFVVGGDLPTPVPAVTSPPLPAPSVTPAEPAAPAAADAPPPSGVDEAPVETQPSSLSP